ncbi:MAG: DUF2956 domain-containing protein [Gammaproteobacteria bacterium HGW-Gammaproteobacteria-3]|nr:MAG: DUF2956 domain-containing protein [Gammaproteobacteria bacterium HGW-Gammaproteobacteria-3]
MTAKTKYQHPSPETQEQSLKIARATQRPGQTKEQTKLIAQGIQKGIEHYKKQQNAKARELDKQLKKVSAQRQNLQNQDSAGNDLNDQEIGIIYKQARLPWVLLTLTWVGIGAYLAYKLFLI